MLEPFFEIQRTIRFIDTVGLFLQAPILDRAVPRDLSAYLSTFDVFAKRFSKGQRSISFGTLSCERVWDEFRDCERSQSSTKAECGLAGS